jgi:hypothetical protein
VLERPKMATISISTNPQFPWPPPPWTARVVVPRPLTIAADAEPLGAIFDRLVAAMRRAQIDQWSVYAIGADGFAIVGRLETIAEDGRPAPNRWSVDPPQSRPFSIKEYLAALFSASPGRYRAIALLVTPRAVIAGEQPIDVKGIEKLLRAGAGELAEELRQVPLPAGGRCEALVYEFARRSADDPVEHITSSPLTVVQHLSGAGLWTAEELKR